MKKTYINPETQIVLIKTMQMLAESLNINKSEKSYEQSLSRGSGRNSSWDDDEN